MKFLLFSLSLHTLSAPDQWFSTDKVQHFFIGTFAQSASFGILRAARVNETPALLAASGFSTAVAIGKELRDRKAGDPSVKDAVWTLAGAAAMSPILARTK